MKNFAPLPDLILMDGGQQHAAVAQRVLIDLATGCRFWHGEGRPASHPRTDDRRRQELSIQHSPPLFALVGRYRRRCTASRLPITMKNTAAAPLPHALDGIPVSETHEKSSF